MDVYFNVYINYFPLDDGSTMIEIILMELKARKECHVKKPCSTNVIFKLYNIATFGLKY